jgi:hypothetical protein
MALIRGETRDKAFASLALLEWPNLMRMCQDLCAATRFVGLRRSLARVCLTCLAIRPTSRGSRSHSNENASGQSL